MGGWSWAILSMLSLAAFNLCVKVSGERLGTWWTLTITNVYTVAVLPMLLRDRLPADRMGWIAGGGAALFAGVGFLGQMEAMRAGLPGWLVTTILGLSPMLALVGFLVLGEKVETKEVTAAVLCSVAGALVLVAAAVLAR